MEHAYKRTDEGVAGVIHRIYMSKGALARKKIRFRFVYKSFVSKKIAGLLEVCRCGSPLVAEGALRDEPEQRLPRR